MSTGIANVLFAVDPDIRYVAVNRGGRIEEMAQSLSWPSHNPEETDRMEELIVNPVVLELARRRGDIDLGGVRRVVIRYGKQYQVLVPIPGGHVSVGVELGADVEAVADKVEAALPRR